MRLQSLACACSGLLVVAACGVGAPTGPSPNVNEEFTLAPNQVASIERTPLRVEFLRVSGDSRCPADALCIQGGDALVHIRAASGAPATYELHTGDASRAAIDHGGYRIELVNLQPYPFSSRTIQPGDYRATLRVSR